ncbi:MAG TPA: hypothetical protein VK163_09360 [Opitutaceae bacterium]|nr:hypothetical protein [Opitutaceae bacterium]
MIRHIIRLLMAVMLVCLAASLRAGEQWETLQAIHLIENPQNSPRPGAHGELGAYQFRQTTWRMHSRAPFRNALVRSHADQVAVAHYDWLVQQLQRNGLRPSAYNIALAWNAGIGAVVSGRAPRASHQYAQRVVNIADELRRATIASSITSRAPMKPIILTP